MTVRQMACHPDLVLRSKNSALTDVQEGTVCRICNDTVRPFSLFLSTS